MPSSATGAMDERAPTVWRVYCREAEGGRDYAPTGVMGGYFALGGTRTGSVTKYASREEFLAAFTNAYGDGGAERAKEVWRLHEHAQGGDWVVMPARGDRTVHIGRIGPRGYMFSDEAEPCRFGHRWAVEWLGTADYALVRKFCGNQILTPGTLAVPDIRPETVAALLEAASAAATQTPASAADHQELERWADRARRTAALARAGYDYAAMRGVLSWETARSLCRLTWITIGEGGDPDPLGTTVSATYWKSTKLPALVSLFDLPHGTETLDAAAERIAGRKDSAFPIELVTSATGFTNFYNAFRGEALNAWLRQNERDVVSILARARHLDSRAGGHHLTVAVASLPDVPRGRSAKGGIAATQLLTPVLACLDPRGQFPILNGADHVRTLLARLGAANSSLADQYDAMVDVLDATDPWRRDAFGLDAHGVTRDLARTRPTVRTGPIQRQPTDGKALHLRDASDIEAIAQGGRRRVRLLHNELTNALIDICKGRFDVKEGDTPECLFDALIRNYDGSRDLLIEVKSTTDRGVLRLAVGQLFDYRRGLPRRKHTDLAVLLPTKPDEECAAFLRDVGVSTLWIVTRGSACEICGDWMLGAS